MEAEISKIHEIKVHGRTTACREPLTLFWTASGFECNVSGSELWVEIEVTYDIYEPWFSYTINGDWIGRQMLPKGRYWICLFRGMNPEKIKNVRFYKDLQAMSADGNSLIHIHAFRFDGAFYPVVEKPLKIEFIGDSITSGEGTFGAKEEEDWIPMFFSALRDYTYFTAEKLNADYQVFSQSGWGVHHSWDNNLQNVIPKYYKEICSLLPKESAKKWGADEPYDFENRKTDIIVINLGTNDANCIGDVKLIQNAIVDFLKTVRECNRQASIIWCYGMLDVPLEKEIREAIAMYVAMTGDQHVDYLRLPCVTQETTGSRQHPGVLCHKQAADVLASFIKNIVSQ